MPTRISFSHRNSPTHKLPTRQSLGSKHAHARTRTQHSCPDSISYSQTHKLRSRVWLHTYYYSHTPHSQSCSLSHTHILTVSRTPAHPAPQPLWHTLTALAGSNKPLHNNTGRGSLTNPQHTTRNCATAGVLLAPPPCPASPFPCSLCPGPLARAPAPTPPPSRPPPRLGPLPAVKLQLQQGLGPLGVAVQAPHGGRRGS